MAALIERLERVITLSENPHEKIAVRAPFTGGGIWRVPAAAEPDVALAVKRARAAQPAWAARRVSYRRSIFLRFHDMLLKRQGEALDLIQLETGKARRHALEEVLDTAAVARYYAFRAGRWLKPQRRRGAMPVFTTTWEARCPVGVVGFISPWNFPLILSITDAIPALLAGNTAIVKPDHQTTLTALWAIDLLRNAGLPPEVFQAVTGEGSVVGPLLTNRVDYIMFTGSTATGRTVARQAADRLIGCSLELGGKNPMIVFPDADIEAAAEGAVRACFSGAGQICIAIERIYAHRDVFDTFLARFAELTRAMRLGPAFDYSADMGCLTSERQLQRTQAHVRDALDKGATLAAGGRARPDLGPLFYEPTILTGVRDGMALYDEETFGPVAAVYPFTTLEEASELANRTAYGLSASIWTRNAANGAALARRIRAGSVNINEGYAAAWASVDSPIGGMKQSGLGRRHGREGLLKFTEAQTVAVQRALPLAPARGITPELFAKSMTALLQLIRRTRWFG